MDNKKQRCYIFQCNPLLVDNELFYINDERDIEPSMLFIVGPRLNMSHYEATLLRDWLTEALEYIEQENKNWREAK